MTRGSARNAAVRSRGRAAWRAARAPIAALAVSGAVGALALTAIWRQAGGPALPLDDAFIHLQYARSIAEGRPFEYVAGQGYTTGATSWLWPALIAPFWTLGLRDLQLVWAAWLLGTIAHAGTMLETARVAKGLCGRTGALLAGAMCAVFGAFAWLAWSGMETLLLSWLLMRTVRVGSECCESPSCPRSRRIELALLGGLGPLVRPEGLIGTFIAITAAVVARGASPPARASSAGPHPPSSTRARTLVRAVGRGLAMVVPIAGAVTIPTTNKLLTGHSSASTAQVKWLPFDPTLEPATIVATIGSQLRFLLGDLLQGNPWTSIFLPTGFGTLTLLGLAALTVGALRPHWLSLVPRRGPLPARLWRGVFVWTVALGTLIPASYATMLWNRVRYIYPFAPAWFVAVSCLGCLLGALAARVRPGLGVVAPALLGGVVGALGAKLPGALSDLARSARAIDRQQVTLGRWATVLPADALIGVNDTGAITYLSGRRTFDVVGLTTEGEARYWMAGAGSRFEHYERLGASRLPSHLIVYPQWLLCPPLIGPELHRATVFDQSILGGATMVAYETRLDLLDSGNLPFAPGIRGALLDELDVSDLESEEAHGYDPKPILSGSNVVGMWPTADGRVVADAGRSGRSEDRFVVELPAGKRALMLMRVSPEGPMSVWAAGVRTLAAEVAGRAEPWWGGWRPVDDPGPDRARTAYEPWVERLVMVTAAASGPTEVVVRASDEGAFTTYHYWWFDPLGEDPTGS